MTPAARPTRSLFPWITGAAIVLFFGAIQLTPPSADALLVPKVGGIAAEALVADGRTPLVLAFSLPSCRICHAAIKVLRTVARDGPADVRYAEVDLERVPELASRFGVSEAPVQLVFVGGRLVHRTAALETVAELERALGRPSQAGGGAAGRPSRLAVGRSAPTRASHALQPLDP